MSYDILLSSKSRRKVKQALKDEEFKTQYLEYEPHMEYLFTKWVLSTEEKFVIATYYSGWVLAKRGVGAAHLLGL